MFATDWILGADGAQDALQIRRVVFVEELGQPERAVFDGCDALCAHLRVRLDGVPVACARLCPDPEGARISFIGVLSAYRRQGFGDLCARVALDKAQRMGAQRVLADVPEKYAAYYASFGFTAQGEAAPGLLRMSVNGGDIVWHSPCASGGV